MASPVGRQLTGDDAARERADAVVDWYDREGTGAGPAAARHIRVLRLQGDPLAGVADADMTSPSSPRR